MEASNLFPGSGACRPATTGALWSDPSFTELCHRVRFGGRGKNVHVCLEVKVETKMCIYKAERKSEKDHGSMYKISEIG